MMLCPLVLAVVLTSFIDPPADARAFYEAAAAKAGRDPEAHFRLACWSESQGFTTLQDQEVDTILKINPNHLGARSLRGQIQVNGRWWKLDEYEAHLANDPTEQAKQRAYEERRSQPGPSVADQLKLAHWCAGQGMPTRARAHFLAVVHRDRTQVDAWKRLGYRLVDGRWTTELLESHARRHAAEVRVADRLWATRLSKIRAELNGPGIPPKTRAALAEIHDPLAAPAVWSTFIAGPEGIRSIGVQVLKQIQGPEATTRLALVALFQEDPGLRNQAIEALSKRDAREFIEPVTQYLRQSLEVQSVEFKDANQPGSISVDGQVVREYAVPSLADFENPQVAQGPVMPINPAMMTANPALFLRPGQNTITYTPTDPSVGQAFAQALANPSQAATMLNGTLANAQTSTHPPVSFNVNVYNTYQSRYQERTAYYNSLRIAKNLRQAELQREARYRQLVRETAETFRHDLVMINAYNKQLKLAAERSLELLQKVSGVKLEGERKPWADWWLAWSVNDGTASVGPTRANPRPPADQLERNRLAAGTLVRTDRGLKPIETIEVGDRVLSRDARTGGYLYASVVGLTPPVSVPMTRIQFRNGLSSVEVSGLERVWKAGQGWVPAQELKPDDEIRLLGLDRARIREVEPSKPQPGYNLFLAEGNCLVIGQTGLLVHDNTIVHPPSHPFDEPADPAVVENPAR